MSNFSLNSKVDICDAYSIHKTPPTKTKNNSLASSKNVFGSRQLIKIGIIFPKRRNHHPIHSNHLFIFLKFHNSLALDVLTGRTAPVQSQGWYSGFLFHHRIVYARSSFYFTTTTGRYSCCWNDHGGRHFFHLLDSR